MSSDCPVCSQSLEVGPHFECASALRKVLEQADAQQLRAVWPGAAENLDTLRRKYRETLSAEELTTLSSFTETLVEQGLVAGAIACASIVLRKSTIGPRGHSPAAYASVVRALVPDAATMERLRKLLPARRPV